MGNLHSLTTSSKRAWTYPKILLLKPIFYLYILWFVLVTIWSDSTSYWELASPIQVIYTPFCNALYISEICWNKNLIIPRDSTNNIVPLAIHYRITPNCLITLDITPGALWSSLRGCILIVNPLKSSRKTSNHKIKYNKVRYHIIIIFTTCVGRVKRFLQGY